MFLCYSVYTRNEDQTNRERQLSEPTLAVHNASLFSSFIITLIRFRFLTSSTSVQCAVHADANLRLNWLTTRHTCDFSVSQRIHREMSAAVRRSVDDRTLVKRKDSPMTFFLGLNVKSPR